MPGQVLRHRGVWNDLRSRQTLAKRTRATLNLVEIPNDRRRIAAINGRLAHGIDGLGSGGIFVIAWPRGFAFDARPVGRAVIGLRSVHPALLILAELRSTFCGVEVTAAVAARIRRRAGREIAAHQKHPYLLQVVGSSVRAASSCARHCT
jgi:hypothetical protein